jgi:hypothetical protein
VVVRGLGRTARAAVARAAAGVAPQFDGTHLGTAPVAAGGAVGALIRERDVVRVKPGRRRNEGLVPDRLGSLCRGVDAARGRGGLGFGNAVSVVPARPGG